MRWIHEESRGFGDPIDASEGIAVVSEFGGDDGDFAQCPWVEHVFVERDDVDEDLIEVFELGFWRRRIDGIDEGIAMRLERREEFGATVIGRSRGIRIDDVVELGAK